jgi:hypothetical protein
MIIVTGLKSIQRNGHKKSALSWSGFFDDGTQPIPGYSTA